MLPLAFASCMMYHPHNVDIPLLREQGDLRIDGSASVTAPLLDGSGLNASISYAPLNHLGVLVSGSVTDTKNAYAHAAIGTFQPFGKSVLEFYAGAATGHSNYTVNKDNPYYVDGNYNILFGQLNYGWNDLLDGMCDIGFGLRGGVMKPDWQHVSMDDDGTWRIKESVTSTMPLFEPQMVFRIGGDHLKFAVNFAYSFIPGWPTESSYFNYSRFSAGIGLNYRW